MDSTDLTTSEIVALADREHSALSLALVVLAADGTLSEPLAREMYVAVGVLSGAVQSLAARCATPEDIAR